MTMRRRFVIFILVLLAILAIAGVMSALQNRQTQEEETGTPAPNSVDRDEDSTTPPPQGTSPTPPPNTSPTPTPQQERNIRVTAPTNGQTISNPVTVTGHARTFEQGVNFRLREANGRVLAEDFTTAQAPELGQFGPFQITINYPEPTQREGVLEVFQSSPRDGSEIDKVIINVRFEE